MRIVSLQGLVSYDHASQLQKELVERRACDEIEDLVLLLEHEPVITRGRGLQFTGTPRPRQMPLPAKLPPGISFAESERGGDLTYHGPGQLVIYPIFKLDGSGPWAPRHDIAGFLRKMEELLASDLRELGLNAGAKPNATGVWVGPNLERKIASIGIAVRKWVTYHGLAINLVNDLAPFTLISPCGFAPEVMTSLSRELPEGRLPGADGAWREWYENRLLSRLGAHVDRVSFVPDGMSAAL